MRLGQLLAELSSKEIQCWIDGENLRVKAPKGSLTPELKEVIASHKDELLSWMKSRQEQRNKKSVSVITRQKVAGKIPLSYEQQRLWFLTQVNENNTEYNIPLSVVIKGKLEFDIFARVINEIERRHNILRTVFENIDGEVVQCVREFIYQEPCLDDYSTFSEEEQQKIINQLVFEETNKSFNLETGPLFRRRLLRLNNETHVLLASMHHIVSDEWSTGVLLREFNLLYEAYSKNQPSPLSELTVQYTDYSLWQRKTVTDGVFEEQLQYWEKQLQEAPVLKLQTDFPRPAVFSHRGSSVGFYLPKKLSSSLRRCVLQHDATLYMFLLSAFFVLLYRLSGQKDICIGTSVAGRGRSELEPLIGFFVNTLVIRNNVPPDWNFTRLLERVKQTTLEALSNQDIPFDRLVDKLDIVRDMSFSPLFQAMFVLQSAGDVANDSGQDDNLLIESLYTESTTAKFDLQLSITESDEQLTGVFQYASDLFSRETIEQLSIQYQTLLKDIVTNPNKRIGNLRILNEEQAADIVRTSFGETSHFDSSLSIRDLFNEAVQKYPDATAVIFENEKITYKKLSQQSNIVANSLQKLGVTTESCVAIYCEKSIDSIVGLIGIIKSGAAYVPLDPQLPAERLAYILSDSRVNVLLTHKPLAQDDICSMVDHCLRLDELGENDDNLLEDPLSTIYPENLAYIIYTSGSTGMPKGVAVEHSQLAQYICAITHRLDDYNPKNFLSVSTLAADLGNTAIFSSLCSGGSLIVPAQDRLLNAEQLSEYVRSMPVDYIKIVPSHFSALLSASDPNAFVPKKGLIFGGESSGWELLSEIQLNMSNVKLINHYGPTETTVGVSTYEYDSEGRKTVSGTVPLGKPLHNTQIMILNSNLNLVPRGVTGEIYIAGNTLSRGYYNKTRLTAERFLPNPYGTYPGERMYKTGDQGRYLTDGNIEFLGRIDHQIKIRGYRIELGEIEQSIENLEQVKQCVVVSRYIDSGTQEIIAFVVLVEGASISEQEIERTLDKILPNFMMPNHFVFLESLPLTANGKIDRNGLPYPGKTRKEAVYLEPETEEEQILSTIWQDLFKIERVGRDDNFFKLGGDSIQSILMISRAMQAGLTFTPQQVFQYQTIRELAAVAEKKNLMTGVLNDIVTGEVPLTPIQHWFFEQNLAQQDHWNQSSTLHVPQDMELDVVINILEELYLQHDVLRMRFNKTESGWRQYYSEEQDKLPFVVVDLSMFEQPLSEYERRSAEIQEQLSLSQGPIWRVVLFDLGNSGKRLLFVVHHLVIDGVSWRVLFDDIKRALEQIEEGRKAQLGAKTASFKDWAVAITRYVTEKKLDQDVNYWQKKFEIPIGNLPIDYPNGGNTVGVSRQFHCVLDEGTTLQILQTVNQAYKTNINDILIAALALTITKWTDEATVLVEMEGHGRELITDTLDISRTVGWFTARYPLYVEVNSELDTAQLLKSIKEQMRAVPNKGVSHGLLKYCHPDTHVRQLFYNAPRPEIVFNYLGQFDTTSTSSKQTATPSEESVGYEISPINSRQCLVHINSVISDNRLEMRWVYSGEQYKQETIQNLAEQFLSSLKGLVNHCIKEENYGYTPSDFPLARLDQKQTDSLFGNIPDIESVFPLSPMQQGMLYHTLYAPDSGIYVNQRNYELSGSIDVQAFNKAWNYIIARHQILKTTIHLANDGRAMQCVRNRPTVTLQYCIWRNKTPLELEKSLAEIAEKDRRSPLDFSVATPFRLTLIELPNNKHHFIWTYHHILLDGWSSAIVNAEVLSTYNSLVNGEEIELPVKAGRYEDFIAWLDRKSPDDVESFWKNYLRDFNGTTRFPFQKINKKDKATIGSFDEVNIVLSANKTKRINKILQDNGLTLNIFIKGIWSILLSRCCSESGVVFGETVSGRPADLPGVENTIGLFINTVPVSAKVQNHVRLLDWLATFQNIEIEKRQFDWTPLVNIQKWVKGENIYDLFEHILVFENVPSSQGDSEEDSSDQNDFEDVVGRDFFDQNNFPLSLIVVPADNVGFRCTFDKNSFEKTDIAQLLDRLIYLIGQVAENHELTVGSLMLTTAIERKRILEHWNDSKRAFPQAQNIIELFEQQVENHPNSKISCDEEVVTYSTINNKANQLARLLKRYNVGPESRIGLCVDRSISSLVGILGILKAGGVYVPLDPDYPADRLLFMLNDAETDIILANSNNRANHILKSTSVTILYLDCLDTELDKFSTNNVTSGCVPNNLAYIMYTSGSTGRPKGVAVTHKNIMRLVKNVNFAKLDEKQTFLQYAPISFDASTFEIWGALLNGGELVIATPGIMSGRDLSTIIRKHKVNTLWLTAALFHSIVDQDVESLRGITQLLAGGDVLSANHIKRVLEMDKNITFINGYGPTENTTFTCCHTVKDLLALQDSVPIGRPVSKTTVYLLGASLDLVPQGIIGELYTGGEGVARGYLGQPALTAERFIPDPFGEPGSRMYRTGDLARYLHDGTIEFSGRVDNQVKIRGHRVELSEIEQVICDMEDVDMTVVVALEEDTQRKLIAYVESKPSKNLTASHVRKYLIERLPIYLIPHHIMILDRLPINANGKIDRHALVPPDREGDPTYEYVLPATDTECKLADIWQTVLNVDRVGISDDFFALGGDSLLAIQIMSLIERDFGIKLRLASLIENHTISSQAMAVEQFVAETHWSPIVTLNQEGDKLPLFFVHEIGGRAMDYMQLSRAIGQDRPIYAFEAYGLEKGQKALDDMPDIVERYVQAMQKTQPTGPYQIAGYSYGGYLAYEIAQCLFKQGEQIALLAVLDTGAILEERTEGDLKDLAMLLSIAYGTEFSFAPEDLRELNEDEQYNYVAKLAQDAGQEVTQTAIQEVRRQMDVCMGFERSLLGYVQAPYEGELVVLRAAHGKEESVDSDPSIIRWRELALGGVAIYDMPMGHDDMLEPAFVTSIADILLSHLRR